MAEKERLLRDVITLLLTEKDATVTPGQLNQTVNSLLQLINIDWNSINEALYHLPPWRIINEAVNSTEADYWITIIGDILKRK